MPQSKQEYAISVQRALLVRLQPFWGSLALNLDLYETKTVPSMATDGRKLYFNPGFVDYLLSDPVKGKARLQTAIAHEVSHCAFRHFSPMRRGARDLRLANIAQDFVVNLELLDGKFEPLPAEWWNCDEKYRNMSFEQVYSLLQQDPKFKDHKCGGCVIEYKGEGEATEDFGFGKQSTFEVEQFWQNAVNQAAINASRNGGHAPGGMLQKIKLGISKQDWRARLSQLLTKPGDVSWVRPSGRFVHQDLYLPGSVPDRMNCLVVALDTSGSVSQEMLNQFATEASAIFKAGGMPEEVYVLYVDTAVQRVDRPVQELSLESIGGGGTYFQPAFDWVEKNKIEPDIMFYLTDLGCADQAKEPQYPVVWVAPYEVGEVPEAPKWGEHIRIDTYEKRL